MSLDFHVHIHTDWILHSCSVKSLFLQCMYTGWNFCCEGMHDSIASCQRLDSCLLEHSVPRTHATSRSLAAINIPFSETAGRSIGKGKADDAVND